jgi:hypothetical protein
MRREKMRFPHLPIVLFFLSGCVGSHQASSVQGSWRANFNPTCDSNYLITIDESALTYRNNGVSTSVPIELREHMEGADATVYLDPRDRTKTAPLTMSLSGNALTFATTRDHELDLALVPYLTMQPLHRCPD